MPARLCLLQDRIEPLLWAGHFDLVAGPIPAHCRELNQQVFPSQITGFTEI